MQMEYLKQLQKTGTINLQKTHSDQEEIHPFVKRLLNQNKQRITTLEKEVSELREKLSFALQTLEKMQDKEHVKQARAKLEDRRQEKPPIDRPIDRNGVAPSEVQLNNIFYAGRRR